MQHVDSAWQWFWRDKHGKVVLWQTPNVPLLAWLVFRGLQMLVGDSSWGSLLGWLASAWLFTWSYQEIRRGVSPFRRALGVVIMALLILSHIPRT